MADIETLKDHLNRMRLARVPVTVTVELGRARRTIKETLDLGSGDILQLDQDETDYAHIYVDGLRYGQCELTTVNGDWAIRVVDVPTANDVQ